MLLFKLFSKKTNGSIVIGVSKLTLNLAGGFGFSLNIKVGILERRKTLDPNRKNIKVFINVLRIVGESLNFFS